MIRANGFLGNFAQGNDGVFVAIAINGQLRTARNLACALCGEQNEIEPVRDLIDAIFNGNARQVGS